MSNWWRTVGQYPATWLVVALVGAAEWALFDWFSPGVFGSLGLGAVGLVSLASWPVVMSATGTVLARQLAGSRDLDDQKDRLMALERQLSLLPDDRPARQLAAIKEKRSGLVDVLSRRLDAGEMTYARYLGSTETVFASVLDNLEEVSLSLRSIDAIDLNYVERRLAELDDAVDSGAATERERTSLVDRRDLRRSQQTKVADLLAQNESAMTAIDRTTTALADAPIGKTPADAEAAMAALEDLARRTGRYATG